MADKPSFVYSQYRSRRHFPPRRFLYVFRYADTYQYTIERPHKHQTHAYSVKSIGVFASVMPFLAFERFAKASGKRGRLVGEIQMRCIAERRAAKLRDPLPPLFGIDRCDRRGSRREMLRKRHGCYTKQVRQHDARDTEMTKQGYRIAVRANGGIMIPLPHISVCRQHLVQPTANFRIFFGYVARCHKRFLSPTIERQQCRMFFQKRGQKIPKNVRLPCRRQFYRSRKFA